MTDPNAGGSETNTSSEAPKTESTEIEIDASQVPYQSDEAIDAALKAPSEADEGEESPSDAEDAVSTDDDTNVSDNAAEDTQENADDGKVSKEAYKELQKEIDKKNREVKASQEFIQKTRSQYGELKKEVLNQIAAIEARADDMNQMEVAQAAVDLRELKLKAKGIEQAEGLFDHVVKTKEEVEASIPEEEWNLDSMVDILEEEGEDPQYIANFRRNPYAVANAAKIKLVHKAAKLKDVARVLAGALKAAQKENAAKSKRPKEILSNIEKVAKNSQGVTGKNGGSRNNGKMITLTEADIAQLSDKELDEALARMS